MTKAFLHGKHVHNDGNFDTFWTKEVEVIEKPLQHHKLGLSYTATGYGSKIPTPYCVKFNGRLRRVYCRIYSNSGTLYITTKDNSEIITVQI